jgi:peroxiredoxin
MKIALMLVGVLLGAPLAGAVEPGAMAPAFSLPSSSGGMVSLEQHKGKIVVLEWLNHDCPFVKKHYGAGNMQALQKEFTGKGIVWLSIISSAKGKQGHATAEQAEAARKKVGSAATSVLLDESGKVGKSYGAKTTPHMFIVNQEGRVVYQGAIDDNSSANPDTIKGAKNYVRMALDALLGGKAVAEGSTQPYGCSVKY